ncbi:MAG: BON domain-containing protein [Pseudomonadales bacterium]|nr:BON domain-containing protein [Pseudomonadales bacterium]
MRLKPWIEVPARTAHRPGRRRPGDAPHEPSARCASCAGAALVLLATSLGGCFSLTGEDPTLRTPGGVIDDEVIETMVARRIDAADERLSRSHINVNSYDGIVLLTGQVENAELRELAESSVSEVKRIRRVHNELKIGGPISLVARTNDNWLETKVRSRLIANPEVVASRIKVVVEDGVVYLVGIVSREQADATVVVTKNVFGVQKIVKVFDYLGEEPDK